VKDNKLVRFFNTVNFNIDFTGFFEEASLKEVLLDKKNNKMTMIIEMDNLVPLEVFKELCEKGKTLEGAEKVRFKFIIKNNDKLFSEYFNYYFDILLNKCPMLKCVERDKITFENNKILVEVLNKAEKEKIESLNERVVIFLSDMGFDDVEVIANINDEARKKFKEELLSSQEFIDNKETKKIIKGSVIGGEVSQIRNLITNENDVVLIAFVFGIDSKSTQSGWHIINLKISDYTDSIIANIFTKKEEELSYLLDNISSGSWYKFRGQVKFDIRSNDYVFNVNDIETYNRKKEKRSDNAEVKRVELHLHTNMSQMDGLIPYKKLLKKVSDFGMKSVAITDKNSIQLFPKLFHDKGDIKILFGCELFVVDDEVKLITKDSDYSLYDEIVVFDFETTGFNAFAGDQIIEIGAVTIKNGEIISEFGELVDPGVKLRDEIINVTNITDDMLKGKPKEEEAFKRFKEYFGNKPMIAHNAKFDVSFIKACYEKYNLGVFDNPVIDTLEMSRVITPDQRRHDLSTLVKRYKVPFDEEGHHRATYDADATAKVYYRMLETVGSNYQTVSDLRKLINIESVMKTARPFHTTVLVKDNNGLKNLFKIISYASTTYFYKGARIPKSELTKYREGLIIGSGCYHGEVFEAAKTKGDDDVLNIMSYYDFIEVNPPSILEHLIETGDFSNAFEMKETIKKIIRLADTLGKITCATGDVHTLDPNDNIYREILVAQKQPGGGLHPLFKPDIKTIPNAYLMNTEEMLNAFDFIDKDKAYEIVVTNTNIISDMIEDVEIIKPGLCAPKMENSAEEMKDIVYTTAHSIYGENLPEIIEERLDTELKGIIGGEYDVIYLIAQKLVKHSNDAGYIVGSRGSVGSSLVATFMNITEVNPLPPHYVCPDCKKSIFELNGEKLEKTYGSGFDMPDLECECGTAMKKQGQNIPFQTFLGFKAEKTPDIDLNFSGEFQAEAHKYTRVLFGDAYVYRAGTITTIAEKTAYGFVLKYMEDKGHTLRRAEIERLAQNITGIKRTTGQHPGGIIVIPKYKEVFDFTPFQKPAENMDAEWLTTHFEFHDIEENVLKLDILGHDDPTVLKYLCDDAGIDVYDIPLDDKKVMTLFSDLSALGLTESQVNTTVGALGVPEFGTKFVMQMLEDTRPKSFAELIKISGLSHGTDVWLGNAQEVIKQGICEFKDVIGCRDDIMVSLIQYGIESQQSFKISEFIRKGKVAKDPETWAEYSKIMKEKNIPDWYIGCCEKIKYMFPKAHAAAYVINGFRVAWFKVYYPLYYYRVLFSIRKSDFEIETMIAGKQAIKNLIKEIEEKEKNEKKAKDEAVYDTLLVANEMCERGFHFDEISLEKSDSVMFKVNEKGDGLIPPFISLPSLGEACARNIVEERDKKPFVSIDDLQSRGKVSQTLIDKMRSMGVLKGLPESSQLCLFDFEV
jgi:DNA polymerase-3 subunit alpha (Gram-positive type)